MLRKQLKQVRMLLVCRVQSLNSLMQMALLLHAKAPEGYGDVAREAFKE